MDWVATMGMTRDCRVRAKAFSSPAGSSSPTDAKLWYSSQRKTAGAVGIGLDLRGAGKQGLEPRVLEEDADGAGEGGVGAGRHVEGDHPAGLDELMERREALEEAAGDGGRGAGRRRREVVADGRGRLRCGGTEDAGHVGEVEHGEEDADAFDDGGPELGVELEPVVPVPAFDGGDALRVLARRSGMAVGVSRLSFHGPSPLGHRRKARAPGAL